MANRRLETLRAKGFVRDLDVLRATMHPALVVVEHLDGCSEEEYWVLRNDQLSSRILGWDEGWEEEDWELVYTDGFVIEDFLGQKVSDRELADLFHCPVKHLWSGWDT